MRIIRLSSQVLLLALLATTGWLVLSKAAPAKADPATFNYTNYLMDDSVFRDNSAMSVSDIQSLLVKEGSGLANFSDVENCSAIKQPYSGYYYPHCGSSETAAVIIYDAAQAYEINPQVILATLQKEQSLITTPNPTSSQLNYAMGYGCPDSGGCSFSGFFNQVDNGTWQFRTDMELINGNNWWGYTPSSYPCNSATRYYSQPLKTGNNVAFMDDYGNTYAQFILPDASTSTLYCYTPHVYPGSSQKYYSGSKNFVYYFTLWFVPNNYNFVTSSATGLNYDPGGTGTVTIVVQNTGFNTWYSDHNLPAGAHPTRLATIGYQNSSFIQPDANSLGTQNQVMMTPDSVAPGANATFTFDVKSPYLTTASSIRLVPIVNGIFLKDVGMQVNLTSNPPAWSPTSSVIGTTSLLPNQAQQATFTVQNNSAITWYSDGNTPVGVQPTRLATAGYQNTPFADTSDPNWLGTRNQIKMSGTSVAPGQTATFTAWFIAPISSTPVTNSFHFMLIVGGVFGHDYGLTFNFSVPAANMTFTGISATNPPLSMNPNQTASVTYTIKNTGNVVWQDETFDGGAHALRLVMSHPVYRSSSFYDPSDADWLSVGQVHIPNGTIMPGQTVTLTWTMQAPSQAGSYAEPFQMAVNGSFYPDYGSAFNVTVP